MTEQPTPTRTFVPWTAQEDDVLGYHHEMANGSFPTYQQIADELNRDFHGGAPVRKKNAVMYRWRKVIGGHDL